MSGTAVSYVGRGGSCDVVAINNFATTALERLTYPTHSSRRRNSSENHLQASGNAFAFTFYTPAGASLSRTPLIPERVFGAGGIFGSARASATMRLKEYNNVTMCAVAFFMA